MERFLLSPMGTMRHFRPSVFFQRRRRAPVCSCNRAPRVARAACELACECRPAVEAASWLGAWTHRIQGCGAIDLRARKRAPPSDRYPDRIECAAVLRAVKVWPGKCKARGKVGVTDQP